MKDNIFHGGISQFLKPEAFFIFMARLMICTELFALSGLSYLGTFSRPIADDYCEGYLLREDPVLVAVIRRFENGGSNRYSNLLFVGLAEKLGRHNIQILPVAMLFLWTAGLVWLIRELRKMTGTGWPAIMDYLLGVSIVFFTAWQAPNRFQIFLWRSGMATHFAPLVFMTLFFAFILYCINTARKPSVWVLLFVFMASFLIGGFSEPPATFMMALLMLLILVVWRWDLFHSEAKRRPALNLLACSLAGMVLAFLTMFFSPTNAMLGDNSPANLWSSGMDTLRFPFNFMDNTFRTQPVPSLVLLLISFILFFVFFMKSETPPLDARHRKYLWAGLLLVPLIQYLLIAASFAPSAYGESYPAERAQILARLTMTTALFIEGALLGMLCAQSRILVPGRRMFFLAGSFLFVLLALYPLRAGLILLTEVAEYREWSDIWDRRESEIYDSIDLGERDLVVRYLPTREGVKEIDGSARHWVNRCAAQYYGVDSIRSVPMDD